MRDVGFGEPSSRVAGRQQGRDRLAERCRDLFNVVDRDISHLALDVCDERAMKAGLESQLFLRPAACRPKPFDVLREDSAGMARGCHVVFLRSHGRPDGVSLTCLSQPRISHIFVTYTVHHVRLQTPGRELEQEA